MCYCTTLVYITTLLLYYLSLLHLALLFYFTSEDIMAVLDDLGEAFIMPHFFKRTGHT